MPGLELCRQFYLLCGAPLIERTFGENGRRFAAGLAGAGSDCLGFDDELSRDHDFGPGFCLWLTDEDDETFGGELERSLPRVQGVRAPHQAFFPRAGRTPYSYCRSRSPTPHLSSFPAETATSRNDPPPPLHRSTSAWPAPCCCKGLRNDSPRRGAVRGRRPPRADRATAPPSALERPISRWHNSIILWRNQRCFQGRYRRAGQGPSPPRRNFFPSGRGHARIPSTRCNMILPPGRLPRPLSPPPSPPDTVRRRPRSPRTAALQTAAGHPVFP